MGNKTNPSLKLRKQDNVEILLAYKKKGYIFHGSPKGDLMVLEPRRASDVNKKDKFNNDTAIFGAVTPEASVLFACMSLGSVPKNVHDGIWNIGASGDDNDGKVIAKIPLKWKPYIVDNSGYVYVLERNNFAENINGWQAKSHKSVIPIDRVEVTFNDFQKLGGVVEWVYE